MGHGCTFRVLHLGEDDFGRDRAGIGRDDGVRGNSIFYHGEDLLLERDTLRGRFDDEVCTRDVIVAGGVGDVGQRLVGHLLLHLASLHRFARVALEPCLRGLKRFLHHVDERQLDVRERRLQIVTDVRANSACADHSHVFRQRLPRRTQERVLEPGIECAVSHSEKLLSIRL